MKRHPFLAALILVSLLSLLSACGDRALRVTSVDPKEAKAGVPALIEIKGNGFRPGAVVRIGGLPSPQTVVTGPKQLVALLPRDLPAGVAAVEVENKDGGKTELASALKILVGLSIASVDPPSVNQGETATVQLIGTGFAADIKVFFNDLPAEAEVKSDRLMMVRVPALPAGLSTIRLDAPDGSRAELASGFQVLGPDQMKQVRRLRDETEKLGLAGPGTSNRTGIAIADFNGDAKLDVVITSASEVRLMLASEEGFKDAGAESGIKAPGISYGSFPADFDNDGRPDLFITGQSGKFFHNLGGAKFEDVTARVGLPTSYMSWSAAWTDYDGDGLLDLYLGSPTGEDMLFHNLGGKFEEVFADRWQKMKNATANNNVQPSTFAVVFGDMNNDGYSELFAGIRAQESRFYRNLGGKNFSFANSEVGLDFFRNGAYDINWGLSWADFDNDGFLDIFAASGPTGNDLYRNIGGKSFTNVTAGMGIHFSNSSLCPAWGDLDNDGWLDLAVTDNENGLFVFRNRGDGSFEDVTADLDIPNSGVLATPMAVAWFDYNGDGALDLLAAGFTQSNRMMVNTPYPGRHYLQIKLEGAKSNHAGVGAVVVLEVQGRKFTQQVAAGSGYLMSPPPILHFGLDQATVIDKITVIWPGGSVMTKEQVPADQLLTLIEPGERKQVPLPPAGMVPPAPAAPAAPPAKPAK